MASRLELISSLCWDDEGDGQSHYPLDCLYWLEGLSYVELSKIARTIKKGEAPPVPNPEELDDMPSAIRRRIAEGLGVSKDRSGEFAASCARGLDLVARAMKKEGVTPPAANRAELLAVATQIYAHDPSKRMALWTVKKAAELIEAVDNYLTPASEEGKQNAQS